MPRQPRYALPDIPQHVIQRGNNRQPVLFDATDYRVYLDCVSVAAEQSATDVHACFGILLSAILTAFSHHRRRAFLLYLVLFHRHLFLDYYGSGPGWGLAYLWPLSSWHLMNPQPWAFETWQNIVAGYACVAWTVGIAVVRQRTPLERLMPSLDRQLVAIAQKWTTTPPGVYSP